MDRSEHHCETANQSLSLIEGNTSFFRSVLNGINAILGNGILLIPYALASGGWLTLVLLLLVSIVTTYSSILIKRCMEIDPRIKTLSDIGELAFGSTGNVIVSIVLCAELYMFDIGFLILEGDNLHNLFPQMSIHVHGLTIGGRSSFVIIVALIVLPSVWLDDLSILSYISATGIFASLLLLGTISCVGVFGGVGFHNNGAILMNWKGVPMAISLYMLCFSCHPVFPVMYTSTEKKHLFSQVMLLSFLSVTIIYGSMAITGYLMFGSQVESEITLNLPTKEICSKIAIYTILVTPLAKYALLLKPVVICVESLFPTSLVKIRIFRIIVRNVLVATQVGITLVLPFFGHLMSLSGALLSTTTALIVPCICYLKISSTNSRRGIHEIVFIWGIIMLSIVVLISGTYTSIVKLLNELKTK